MAESVDKGPGRIRIKFTRESKAESCYSTIDKEEMRWKETEEKSTKREGKFKKVEKAG